MKTSDFNFELPQHLIAQSPILNRSQSKLLALNKQTGAIEHKNFHDITDYLNSGDCLVINDTKVISARLIGKNAKTGGAIEIFLLKQIDETTWETLAKPGKKATVGCEIVFGDGELSGVVIGVVEGGNRLVKFTFGGVFMEVLERLGEVPLPPYITEKLDDKARYQTVYAAHEGSVAAPTAGLHFTPELLQTLENKGVLIAKITLHVGLGTFRPVKAENILDHEMHSETYVVNEIAAQKINQAKQNGGKIIAVGTTSARTLEAIADESGNVCACDGQTDIFIYPSYKFKIVDTLITNFHLPQSTLIMLVSALAGRENVLSAYEEAIRNEYRFFSFGDAMYIY